MKRSSYLFSLLAAVKFILLILFCMGQANAQSTQNGVEMAEALRSSGKIYIVVAVMCVVFIGLAFYLFAIDKRLGRLEKK